MEGLPPLYQGEYIRINVKLDKKRKNDDNENHDIPRSKKAICNEFQHLELKDYETLQSDRGGKLKLAENQSPDGTTGIIKWKAVLYIRPKLV